jgi:subtilisin family serine protease
VFSNKSKDEFIIVLKSDSVHSKWLNDCWGIGTKSIHDNDFSSKKVTKNMALSFTVKGTKLMGYSGEFSTEFIEKHVATRSDVKYVEKNGKVKINYAVPSPNELFKRTTDSSPDLLFNLDRIDQAKFPVDGKYTFPDTAGKGVNIFVVDTGVDAAHVEFEGRAKFLRSFCQAGAQCKKGDGNGHGTHVSGTAAGKTVGVARKANILGIQVLDDNGSGSNVGVINGLSFVLNQHNSGTNKNSVVSMSLGGGKAQAVNDAVKALTAAGVHVVVAAGNESQDACGTSPASELSAVTVCAIENNRDAITDFSNVGKCVDICAPGRQIVSAEANTKDGLVAFDGTSQATPHVSGTIALIIAKSGNSSPAAMAKTLIDLSSKGVLSAKGLRGTPNNVLRVPAA